MGRPSLIIAAEQLRIHDALLRTLTVMIAVMANNLGRWIELKAEQTLESLQRLFDNLRVQKVQFGESTYWQCVELESEQQAAIRRMGYTLPPARFTVTVDPRHQTGVP